MFADKNKSPRREAMPLSLVNDSIHAHDQASSTAEPVGVSLDNDHSQAANASGESFLSRLTSALGDGWSVSTADQLVQDASYDELQQVVFQHTRKGKQALVEKLFQVIKKTPNGVETIARLVKAEDECGLTLLMISARQDMLSLCELLVAEGADVNQYNDERPRALLQAAQKGHVRSTRFLLEHGANDESKSPALMPAAHFGHLETVRVLLEFGADPNYSNIRGTTPLMRAAQEGHDKVVQFLIDKGARVDVANNAAMNALMLTSQRGHSSTATLLIKAGVDIDKPTRVGSTALMLAAKRGHVAVVDVLLAVGADIFLKDDRRKTAAEMAHRRGHEDVSLKITSSARQTCRL